MSASKVIGKNVVVKVMRILDADYFGFYCAQEVSINFQTDQIPATGPDSGSYKRFKPGRTAWDVTLTGITFIKDVSDSLWTAFDLTDEQARQNGLDVLITFTNDNGAVETFQGRMNPETTGISGSASGGALSKFNLKLQGDGLYARNASVPTPGVNNIMRIEYTGTGGETFFTLSATINKEILEVSRESSDALFIITSGTPGAKQVKFTAASGRFDIDGNPAGVGEQFVILYR